MPCGQQWGDIEECLAEQSIVWRPRSEPNKYFLSNDGRRVKLNVRRSGNPSCEGSFVLLFAGWFTGKSVCAEAAREPEVERSEREQPFVETTDDAAFLILPNNPKPLSSSITYTAWGGNERSTSPCSRGNTITLNRWVAIMPCISTVWLPCSSPHPSAYCCLLIRQSAPELDSAR